MCGNWLTLQCTVKLCCDFFLSALSQKDTLASWTDRRRNSTVWKSFMLLFSSNCETALKFTAVTHANQKQSSCAKRCGSEQSDSTTITLQLCAGNNCLCDLAGIWVILGNGDTLMFGFLTCMHPLWWDFFFLPKLPKLVFVFLQQWNSFSFFKHQQNICEG